MENCTTSDAGILNIHLSLFKIKLNETIISDPTTNVTCHIKHVPCHMPHVTCHSHVSHVTCHMSRPGRKAVKKNYKIKLLTAVKGIFLYRTFLNFMGIIQAYFKIDCIFVTNLVFLGTILDY